MMGSNKDGWRGRVWAIALVIVVVSLGLMGCGDRTAEDSLSRTPEPMRPSSRLVEVAPPDAIQVLGQQFQDSQPQVKILSPSPNSVLNDNQVSVRFGVENFELFKDEDLGLGPHLHVFLDDEPYVAVYDPSEPLVLSDLAAGTHTLRVFASRPWHESFKTDGAYAQVQFHVFTKTPEKAVDAQQPLLTYSRPQGVYGAEPVMLDFYLSNLSPSDRDAWQVKVTVNGTSFTTDEWRPIYLKGLKPGKNWVQLELLNPSGEAIANAFNPTARIITYEPGGQDTLSRLVTGQLSAADARNIVGAPPIVEEIPEEVPDAALKESDAVTEESPAEDEHVEDVPKEAIAEEDTEVTEEDSNSQDENFSNDEEQSSESSEVTEPEDTSLESIEEAESDLTVEETLEDSAHAETAHDDETMESPESDASEESGENEVDAEQLDLSSPVNLAA
jgi:hypothetical protein